MERLVHVNGNLLPEAEAKISVFDRGVLFADAVYEVCAVLDGKLVDTEAHFARLRRSIGELRFALPQTDENLLEAMRDVVRANRLEQGMLYLQVSRGTAADRDFLPPLDATPNVFMFTQAKDLTDSATAQDGIRVVTVPDQRWARRDIKTVGLLAASMAKLEAVDQGADDVWMVEDGYVTEGSSNNAYIVLENNRIVTRALSHAILAGCTRAAVLRLAREKGLVVEERGFTPEESQEAMEAFMTSASGFVTGVVSIDGRVLSNGKPGPITSKLREIYLELARKTAV